MLFRDTQPVSFEARVLPQHFVNFTPDVQSAAINRFLFIKLDWRGGDPAGTPASRTLVTVCDRSALE